MSFEDATRRLNSANVSELWALSSALSLIEYYGAEKLGLFPALTFETPRLLSWAIMESRASDERHRALRAIDLSYVINNVQAEGLSDPRLEEEVLSGRPREEMNYNATQILSRWGGFQLAPQEFAPRSAMARSLGLFEVLPSRPHLFSEDRRDLVINAVTQIKECLGGPVLDLAGCFMLVLLWHRRQGVWFVDRTRQVLSKYRPAQLSKRSRGHRFSFVLEALLSDIGGLAQACTFTVEDLGSADEVGVSHAQMRRFLSLFAADTRHLRSLLATGPFRAGSSLWKLNPLQRHPIVALPDHRFVVPVFRLYLASFEPVLDYTLVEHRLPHYNEFRGAVFEKHLQDALTKMLPGALVVPERTYKRGRQEVKGPDVMVVSGGDPLVLIEAKSRRIGPAARTSTDRRYLDQNLEDAFAAIARLKEKLEDLRRGLPEYEDIQPELDRSLLTEPIFVCILPETIPFITELVRYPAAREASHPLHGLPGPFCIISIEKLERILALIAQKKSSLAGELLAFWARACSSELSAPSSDHIGDEGASEDEVYSMRYLRPTSSPLGNAPDS